MRCRQARVIIANNDQPRLLDINANVMEQTIDVVMPAGGGARPHNMDYPPKIWP